ncbi:MAG TPA: translocation/assembly module TamB domain-containing protein [Gemmatimonadales bacterium]|nr:translocation/assembly module TamB domain-containing protein [Gemmatimonadales bacterium]
MARRALLLAGALVAGVVVLAFAAAALVLASGPGHAVARRLAVAALEGVVDGRVRVGSLGGPLWREVDARDVELATPDGRPVIRVAHLTARYALADLVRRRFVLSRVVIDGPAVTLEEGADGHLNLEHLFRLLGPHQGPPGRRPVVDLRDVRLTHGVLVLRERGDGGAPRIRQFTGIRMDLARLRASNPDTAGVAIDLRHLAVTISDPAAVVRDAAGRATVEGDSVRFALPHLALPGTVGAANGVVRWGRGVGPGRARLDLAANLRRASFADFRWAAAGLPASGGGRVRVRARLLEHGSEWSFADADLRSGRSALRGSVELAAPPDGPVRIGKLSMDAKPLDLAVLEPLVGRLPVGGAVSGHLTASGPLTGLAVGADLAFTDERVPGHPVNRLTGSGVVTLGGRDGFTFHHFAVSGASLSMETIERLAPSVGLHGELGMAGDLDGPWRAATFDGSLSHDDGEGDPSRLRGTIRLGLADTLRVDADVVADSVSLDDVARSYRSVALAGMVSGRVRLAGPVTGLAYEADLSGPGGAVRASGEIAARDSAVHLRGSGSFSGIDLARRVPGGPPSRLDGTWRADVVLPTASDTAPTTGTLALLLDSSEVAGIALDRAGASLTLTRDAVAVDTAYADQREVGLVATGSLGRPGRPAGRLRFAFRADTLEKVWPLVSWARKAAGDTTPFGLGGAGRVSGQVVGTTAAWTAQGDVSVDSVALGPIAAMAAHAAGSLERSARGWVFGLRASAETLAVDGMRYQQVAVGASGPLDSLRLHAAAAFGLGSSVETDLALGLDSTGWTARVTAGRLALPQRVWQLARPASIVSSADAVAVDSLELRAESGGLVRITGRVPRAQPGDLSLEADSVPLWDLYALAELDTTGIGGLLDARVRVVGPAGSPRIEAAAGVTDGRFGDFHAPRLEGSASYADRRLVFSGGLGNGGGRVVNASGSLPLDLALEAVARRQLPDSLRIRVRADSVDLAILDALTPLVRGVSGRLVADVSVEGTWERPDLTGSARIVDGAVGIPALGARYSGIEARLSLSGDRLRVEDARLRGGAGTLAIGGDVRFEALTHPMLDLTLKARSFSAFSQRDFAGLTVTGELRLAGPAVGATLTGGVVVDAGFLAFADLVEKRIVNLDDPEFRAVVDSSLAQATGLGPSVQNVLLDSLRIRDLTVAMGPDVWLRSHEANIQLAGSFTVAKDVEAGASRYRLDGTLRAVRGTYRLVVGPTAKEFRVTRGTVRFFGTPDLNPVLDIAAEHTVRSVSGGDLVVRAVIGGTLLVPKLSLESDERPPLSETEIVSYLLFGRPSFDLASGGGGGGGGGTATSTSEQAIFQGAMAGLAGALSGELEQTLVTNLGIPVDYIAIRPGGGTVGDIFSSTRVEAGTQLGERTFLTLNAGLCQVARGLSSQALGASVEHRLTGRFTMEASIEPTVEECRPVGFQIRPPAPYQIGFDLFWQWGTP